MNETAPLNLTNPPGIYWRQVAGCTIVIDEPSRRAYRLVGIPEVVWHCLALSYPYKKIVKMVANLQGQTSERAGQELRAILAEWQALGLLQASA